MPGAGLLRDRLRFERVNRVSDDGGGSSIDWRPIDGLAAIRGGFFPERSRERLEAGRLQSAVAGTLKVRSSDATRQVTAADRVIINDVPYDIHAITNPDRRGKYLEMTVERGTGQ